MGIVAVSQQHDLEVRQGLQDLIDSFLISQDIGEGSRRTYGRNLKQFTVWIQQHGQEEPGRQTILQFKKDLEAQGLSPYTINSYMVTVRRFYAWAETEGYYRDITRGIKGVKRAKGFKKDPLTVRQIKDLLASIDRDSLEGKRDYALLNLLIRTGLRTIEVTRADFGDIRQQGGEAVLWIQGKGRTSKDEFVLLTPETLNPINTYLNARGRVKDNEPLFASLSDRNQGGRLTTRSISRIAKQHLVDIGLDNGRLTAHSLRHTAITLSLLGGATIQEAQTLARHADVNTTLIYSHNINRLAQAPERKIDALLKEDI